MRRYLIRHTYALLKPPWLRFFSPLRFHQNSFSRVRKNDDAPRQFPVVVVSEK